MLALQFTERSSLSLSTACYLEMLTNYLCEVNVTVCMTVKSKQSKTINRSANKKYCKCLRARDFRCRVVELTVDFLFFCKTFHCVLPKCKKIGN